MNDFFEAKRAVGLSTKAVDKSVEDLCEEGGKPRQYRGVDGSAYFLGAPEKAEITGFLGKYHHKTQEKSKEIFLGVCLEILCISDDGQDEKMRGSERKKVGDHRFFNFALRLCCCREEYEFF